MSEALAPISLRLPPDYRRRLEALAAKERRSVNSQIVVLIERALPAAEKAVNDTAGEAA